MLSYFVRRLLVALPTLLGVTFIVFSIVRVLPGDPAQAMAGVHATQDYIERVRKELGLDLPIHVQYVRFLRGLLRGDLGRSIRTGLPVAQEVWTRFLPTLELTAASLFLTLVVGVLVGILSATKPYSLYDHASMFLSLAGLSLPVFWLGLMLMLLFSVRLGWLPAAGRGGLRHLVLPALTLAASSVALVARFTRSTLLEVLRQEYITTARAKGVRESRAILVHALRNALIPIVTIVGLRFGALLSGAVLTETVFAWPGVGRLVVDSVSARDYPVIQGTVLVIAACFVFINLAVDLLYGVINPRIRYD
ncbi:MAG: ABC transporter permease [Candidatus Bipolaricaulota bacterium]|nr:ABC transporter permease [Candidatus Bipolaricaulota bacterium]MDW8151392.1 ABC transporter permease [Candidatus Bipolaricaulota bacterium]